MFDIAPAPTPADGDTSSYSGSDDEDTADGRMPEALNLFRINFKSNFQTPISLSQFQI